MSGKRNGTARLSGEWNGPSGLSGTALRASAGKPTPHFTLPSKGFTLVEMVMVIVITGIIGGIVAVFLTAPVRQYVDVARRADMTDIADTALRRITRDVRLALPNSVRVAGTCDGTTTCFLEFLPAPSGGRYRADIDATDDVCPGGNSDDD